MSIMGLTNNSLFPSFFLSFLFHSFFPSLARFVSSSFLIYIVFQYDVYLCVHINPKDININNIAINFAYRTTIFWANPSACVCVSAHLFLQCTSKTLTRRRKTTTTTSSDMSRFVVFCFVLFLYSFKQRHFSDFFVAFFCSLARFLVNVEWKRRMGHLSHAWAKRCESTHSLTHSLTHFRSLSHLHPWPPLSSINTRTRETNENWKTKATRTRRTTLTKRNLFLTTSQKLVFIFLVRICMYANLFAYHI